MTRSDRAWRVLLRLAQASLVLLAAAGESQAEPSPARGQGPPLDLAYTPWHKSCFEIASARMVCRTTVTGSLDTGQEVLRADIISDGSGSGFRLQLLILSGLFVKNGLRISIDGGRGFDVPYLMCFSNACLADTVLDERFVAAMKSGRTMRVELTGVRILSIAAAVPLAQFASTHDGKPALLYDRALEPRR